MGDFKKRNLNFLGVKNIVKDLEEMPKYFKILLIVSIVVILFFNFFNVQGGNGNSFFVPLAQYNHVLEHGSTFGQSTGSAIAVAVLYSLNGIAAFTGVVAVAMIVEKKTSQYFWGVINALFYGLFALSVGYLGDTFVQVVLVLGAPLGWYLFEIKGINKKPDEKRDWSHNLMFFIYIVLALAIATLVLYEFLPSASDAIFGEKNSKYADHGLPLSESNPTAIRVLDSMTNGFNFVAYGTQLSALPEQFYLWVFIDILKILKYSGVAGTDTMSINLMIAFFMFLVLASVGVWNRGIKVSLQNTKIGAKIEHKFGIKINK